MVKMMVIIATIGVLTLAYVVIADWLEARKHRAIVVRRLAQIGGRS